MRYLIVALLVLTAAPVAAQTPRSGRLEELKQLSIEELVDTDVTTASRRIERLADVAAAVTVITGEDLRRTGVTTLPEALRLAGHLHVARVSGPQYVVGARGFVVTTANKLLVLMDGRTLYSPVYGGTFWESQDFVVSDIERIEITRGPGGSVWGANAMNGVINIISKKAADTRGTLVNFTSGSSVLGPFAIRHGGRLGGGGSYRAYAKVRFEDSHQLESGADAGDDFDFGQAGFRLESNQSGGTMMFLQGDLYTGTTGRLNADELNLSGGNLLARWSRNHGGHSSNLQAYYDHTYRRAPDSYRGVLNTIDVDAQHQWNIGRHQWVFGAGYRRYDGDDFGEGPGFVFEPRERTSHRLNVFAHDEIRVARGVFLTVGSKFERNGFTGLEIQPTVRGRWSSARQSLWASVSRAVRVPTRIDTDFSLLTPAGAPLLTGSTEFDTEKVLAYEAGYRRQVRDRFSIDLAGYVNRYDDLRSQEARPGRPTLLDNMRNGLTRGLETTATAQLLPRWQLHASHAYFWKELTLDPGSTDITRGVSEGNDPRQIVKLRSYVTVTTRIEIDTFYRRYSSLPQPPLAAYQELDARIGFRVAPGWDLSVLGHNLLHDRQVEFRSSAPPEAYERSIALRSVWRF